MSVEVKVEGLREFQRNLKKLDRELPKALRMALNDATEIVVTEARPRIPRRSGRAASTLKMKSTQTRARVSEGGSRAPYVPWLDFGGQIGKRSGKARGQRGVRPYLGKHGRYVFAAYNARRREFKERMVEMLVDLAHKADLN